MGLEAWWDPGFTFPSKSCVDIEVLVELWSLCGLVFSCFRVSGGGQNNWGIDDSEVLTPLLDLVNTIMTWDRKIIVHVLRKWTWRRGRGCVDIEGFHARDGFIIQPKELTELLKNRASIVNGRNKMAVYSTIEIWVIHWTFRCIIHLSRHLAKF